MRFAFVAVVVGLLLASCRPGSDSAGSTRETPQDVAGSKAGEAIPVEAIVARMTGGAAWDHETDGSFAVYDAVTFKITEPAQLDGGELSVYFSPLPENSPLRTAGTRCSFRIDARYLRPPEPGESREVYEGALEDLAVLR